MTRHDTESSGAVARRSDAKPPRPHRAVRALYEPPNAEDLVKRFLESLDACMRLVAP
jgi:hypothetical protein